MRRQRCRRFRPYLEPRRVGSIEKCGVFHRPHECRSQYLDSRRRCAWRHRVISRQHAHSRYDLQQRPAAVRGHEVPCRRHAGQHRASGPDALKHDIVVGERLERRHERAAAQAHAIDFATQYGRLDVRGARITYNRLDRQAKRIGQQQPVIGGRGSTPRHPETRRPAGAPRLEAVTEPARKCAYSAIVSWRTDDRQAPNVERRIRPQLLHRRLGTDQADGEAIRCGAARQVRGSHQAARTWHILDDDRRVTVEQPRKMGRHHTRV